MVHKSTIMNIPTKPLFLWGLRKWVVLDQDKMRFKNESGVHQLKNRQI